jgi:hypothetical protein
MTPTVSALRVAVACRSWACRAGSGSSHTNSRAGRRLRLHGWFMDTAFSNLARKLNLKDLKDLEERTS